MKNKKIVIIFSVLLILILVLGYFGIKYAKNKSENVIEEYTPEQEITEEQSRQTIVSLYFPKYIHINLVPDFLFLQKLLIYYYQYTH